MQDMGFSLFENELNLNDALDSTKVHHARHPVSKRRVGPYLIGKTLGVGSTCNVKLGTHVQTGDKVAVKIILKDNFKKAGTCIEKQMSILKKMEREITLMKLIEHPNVLRLIDVYEKHVEGGELFDYIVKKGRLSEDEALDFFQQIIFGIEFSHKHFVCHRDLKPENLLLDHELNIKIADFGMANLQGPGRLLETSCGSPHYAAPEIVRGIKYDGPTADIWSCGVILYALLSGTLPFDDENMRRLLAKVKSGIFHIPSFIDFQARDLIKRMLTTQPELRITIQEIRQHPWFNKKPPKKMQYQNIKPALDQLKLSSVEQADSDILRAMELLGWEDLDELMEALTNEHKNSEKMFYFLLQKRKSEMSLDRNVHHCSVWDIEGGPKRRTESFGSLPSTPRTVPSTPIKITKPIDIERKSPLRQSHMIEPTTTSPKRQWFPLNLFSVSVHSITLKSTLQWNQFTKVLDALDIQYQERVIDNQVMSYKCKYSTDKNGDQESVKFRLNFESEKHKVKAIHQQGSQDLFVQIMKQFEKIFEQ